MQTKTGFFVKTKKLFKKLVTLKNQKTGPKTKKLVFFCFSPEKSRNTRVRCKEPPPLLTAKSANLGGGLFTTTWPTSQNFRLEGSLCLQKPRFSLKIPAFYTKNRKIFRCAADLRGGGSLQRHAKFSGFLGFKGGSLQGGGGLFTPNSGETIPPKNFGAARRFFLVRVLPTATVRKNQKKNWSRPKKLIFLPSAKTKKKLKKTNSFCLHPWWSVAIRAYNFDILKVQQTRWISDKAKKIKASKHARRLMSTSKYA